MSDQIFVAKDSGVLFTGGRSYTISKNKTRVRAGHPLLKNNAHLFRELDVDFDVEDTTARPGQKRGGRRRAPDDDSKSSQSGSKSGQSGSKSSS